MVDLYVQDFKRKNSGKDQDLISVFCELIKEPSMTPQLLRRTARCWERPESRGSACSCMKLPHPGSREEKLSLCVGCEPSDPARAPFHLVRKRFLDVWKRLQVEPLRFAHAHRPQEPSRHTTPVALLVVFPPHLRRRSY